MPDMPRHDLPPVAGFHHLRLRLRLTHSASAKLQVDHWLSNDTWITLHRIDDVREVILNIKTKVGLGIGLEDALIFPAEVILPSFTLVQMDRHQGFNGNAKSTCGATKTSSSN